MWRNEEWQRSGHVIFRGISIFTLIYMCVPWLLAKEITAISRKQGPPYHVVGGPFVLLIPQWREMAAAFSGCCFPPLIITLGVQFRWFWQLINTQTKLKLSLKVFFAKFCHEKTFAPDDGSEGNVTRLCRFWETEPTFICPCKTPPSGYSARRKNKTKEFFPLHCTERRVVKGFGSGCLTKAGAACVRASFMAVEIWCGE